MKFEIVHVTATVAVLGLMPASAAAARSTELVARTLSEPAGRGLPVSGPLDGYVATSRARIVVRRDWRALDAPAGRLRLAVTQSSACRYTVTYRAAARVAPPQDAAAYVADTLRAAGPRYVLDSGTRAGNRAYRVIRRPSTDGRVRLDALWTGALTRRTDIVPAGQQAWTDVRVSAVSRAGDECHSGTWRESVGPSLGDSLAVARTALRVVRRR